MSKFTTLRAIATATVSLSEDQQAVALKCSFTEFHIDELVQYCKVTKDFEALIHSHLIKHLREAAAEVTAEPEAETEAEDVDFFTLISERTAREGLSWADINEMDEVKEAAHTPAPTPAPTPATTPVAAPTGAWVKVASRLTVGQGTGHGAAPAPKKVVVNHLSERTRNKVCASCVFDLGEHPKDKCWFIPEMQLDAAGSPLGWSESGRHAWTTRKGATVRHRRLATGSWVHEIRSQSATGRRWGRTTHDAVVQHLAEEKAARRRTES